jgi:hypothetical protein
MHRQGNRRIESMPNAFLFEPAMHAGELILTVVYKQGQGIELD